MSTTIASSIRTVLARRAPTLMLRGYATAGPPPTRPCPNCNTSHPITTTPCPSCSALLPVPFDLSHHSVLGVSQPIAGSSHTSKQFDIPAELSSLAAHGYDLQPRDLRGRMLRIQNLIHPDKFANQGEGVVALARDLSGRINDAYGTLSDPLKRADYILSVYAQGTEETDSVTDPMLLAEILEAREELEMASSEEEVNGIRESNHAKVESTIAGLIGAFSKTPPDLAEAKNLAVQLKYWQGLESAAKDWSPK